MINSQLQHALLKVKDNALTSTMRDTNICICRYSEGILFLQEKASKILTHLLKYFKKLALVRENFKVSQEMR